MCCVCVCVYSMLFSRGCVKGQKHILFVDDLLSTRVKVSGTVCVLVRVCVSARACMRVSVQIPALN